MTKSMTAFASSETEIGVLTVNCELRSVNHRYTDILIKLPERLRFAETEIRSAIMAKISRGKIECTITSKKQIKDSQSLFVNRDAVAALLTAARQIEEQMTAPQSFSALEVLAFPGIQQEPELDKDELNRGITALVNRTLLKLLEVREREGQQLQVLIEDRCRKMQLYTEAAQKRMPDVLQAIRNKLKDRITDMVAQPDFDRLEQELVFLTQKLDIAEELDRLETHITEVLRVVQQDEPVGRRLDFLMQEMNREANTMGAKSSDKEITKISIELKVLIEQIREQIQNIE
ncbi:YicC/YloC family endoribonuclease [Methylomicrobium lacus]|uniref:YicC/YloC family endoribonuclease n=1 Tax=Methylomicrobium lacus TaxID=136992 RepID=UPI00045E847D|nr:YicC/YloC family endoribonuclease [Methylomicrobium lacus]